MQIKTLISQEEIQERIKELARQIEKDYNSEEIVMIVILNGAAFFAMDLAKNITSSVLVDFMKISSYSGTQSTGNLKMKLDLSQDILDKNVLIVEDIVDTGRTLYYLKDYLLSKSPKSLKICTLLNKEERREFDISADYVAFDIPNKFVIGYGLDYDEKYRNLPYIAYVE